MRKILLVSTLIATVLGTSACSKMFGGLRRDLDDQQTPQQYTSGGQWPEHHFLDDDMAESGDYTRYDAVGHSERSVASLTDGKAPGDSNWVTPADQVTSQRETLRGANADGSPPSFSASPNLMPNVRRQYKNGQRATRADFVDDSQNEGSLWASDGQTNYYFTKNRIRGVGDIITIKMENPFLQDVGAEIRRTLTNSEKDAEIQSAQARLDAGAGGAAQAQPNPAASGGPAPASVASTQTASDKDIDVTKSIDSKEGDPVMAEIVDRYPNGNYKIRGTKKVIYKNGTPRLLTLLGIARSQDIGEDDTIPSGKLYEYRLEAYR